MTKSPNAAIFVAVPSSTKRRKLVCLSLALLTLSACGKGSPWPTHGGDPQGRWEAPVNANSTVSSSWAKSISDLGLRYIYSCPTVSRDNELVAASADGKIFKINPLTHNMVIIDQSPDSVRGTVNMQGGKPVVSDSGNAYHVREVGGWSSSVVDLPSAPNTNGSSVFVSANKFVYAFDRETGSLIKQTNVGDEIVSIAGPAIAPEAGVAVVVATLNGRVVKLDPETGSIKWDIPISGARFNNGVSIALNGTIFVRSFEGRLYVIGPNGNLLPNHFDSGTSNPVNNGKGSLFGPAVSTMGSSAIAYVVDQTRKLTAVSDQGQILWQRALPDLPVDSNPVAAGDTVYVQVGASPNTKLIAVTRDTVRWSVDVGYPTCLAVGRDGYIFGISGSTAVRIIKIS